MKIVLLCFLFSCIFVYSGSAEDEIKIDDEMALPEIIGQKFLYFGFGSNLLLKRIRLQNPSAVRKDIGKLKDYELDFYSNSSRWNGAPATIVPSPGKVVWGAIWEIDLANMNDLDRQESVHEGVYIPLSLPIETLNGEKLTCRVYRLKNNPEPLPKNAEIPYNRQPSYTYIKTIIKGGIESGLPADYIEQLRSIKHNGNIVKTIELDLELQ